MVIHKENPWAMGCSKKSFMLVWCGATSPVHVCSNGYLPWGSCQYRLSANDKGDNEMKPRALYRFSWHLLYGWGKPQLVSNENYVTSHCLKWELLPHDVCRIAQHVKEGEGRKEGMDGTNCYSLKMLPILIYTWNFCSG